ncbi:hypothetical protein CLIB1444_06S02322 [[Candida] jaroonii]|uniref:Uncharacterized protein n=1 Tax=[Candida] jaroonii TaxID=467808 RepID=A0ACA9Y9S9_9ASCO|nr:hypothetical protein CLIB1444_06S02322 [[Candida] jaroonii]
MTSNYNSYEEQIDPSFDRKLNYPVDNSSLPNINVGNNLPSVSNISNNLNTTTGLSNSSLSNSNLNNNMNSNLPNVGSNLSGNPGISIPNLPLNNQQLPTNQLDDDDKHRRPVSTTKRAAQNRSAQKAFRQRREKYIKDLETQAAEVPNLKQTIEDLRSENLRLRDYTIALQSKLIEMGSDGFNNDNASSYNKITERQ